LRDPQSSLTTFATYTTNKVIGLICDCDIIDILTNFILQPKDIPVRLIKREVEPPAALASSEVMPSRLERDVFSYAPLPQAEKVVKNKPVMSLPSATEVAEQILQASLREMQKSTELSRAEGAEINVVSPFKNVEKSSQSISNLQPKASASSPNENSCNTVKKNNKQAAVETSQKGTYV
jgi:hypothetical protein